MSPVLANLFLHYAFDVWMTREHPHLPWCRYADDGLIHCHTEAEAPALKAAFQVRLAECRLEMHPDKIKIAYCKDSNRKEDYANKKFNFLGYTFRPTLAINPKQNKVFVAFLPRVSTTALKSMRQAVHDLGVLRRTQHELADIARHLNPLLTGWLNYYGRYTPSTMDRFWRWINAQLMAWIMRKYKRYTRRKIKVSRLLTLIASRNHRMFVHGHRTAVGAYAFA
ncbi:group II intron maturase-specific domain-containing protein [Asticcacaulis sp. W401b]|uniref:group II intron maturase-specific domain-containing protein n=1 Tax=Asticcacaulis sp. W401b TaxID=3388666 RepID=UPI003970D0D9